MTNRMSTLGHRDILRCGTDLVAIAVADIALSHLGAGFMGTWPSTTLAECVLAAVFQEFAFGNMGIA
ncbi:hypothetical protein, partial [Bradyrhizobium ottawaense]|uniref:hypothetical protein n=1 Tax=Bradyrhizobium ottawaense TaxID=931866 RepID=UPI001BA49710